MRVAGVDARFAVAEQAADAEVALRYEDCLQALQQAAVVSFQAIPVWLQADAAFAVGTVKAVAGVRSHVASAEEAADTGVEYY